MGQRDLAGTVYGEIRDLIVRGRIAPEKRLVEKEMAARFGVSRTPVRDALNRLRHEGYVRDAGSGAKTRLEVAPLARSDVDELWPILGQLEAEAIQRAAELPPENRRRLTDEMRRVNRALLEAALEPSPDPDVLMDLQSGFHRVFVDRTGGPWVRRVYAYIRPHAERYEWVYGSLGDADIPKSVEEHEEIIDLVDRGDGPGARRAVVEHWRTSQARTGSLIARLEGADGEPG